MLRKHGEGASAARTLIVLRAVPTLQARHKRKSAGAPSQPRPVGESFKIGDSFVSGRTSQRRSRGHSCLDDSALEGLIASR